MNAGSKGRSQLDSNKYNRGLHRLGLVSRPLHGKTEMNLSTGWVGKTEMSLPTCQTEL